MLAINFWVWFSVGPVGLRLTGPSAKLLITLIIFKFILDACYLCLQVNAWNCNQINATIVFIYPYLAAKTSVLKYVLHCPYVLSGCVIGIYSFRSSEFFSTWQHKAQFNFNSRFETDFGEDFTRYRRQNLTYRILITFQWSAKLQVSDRVWV